MVSMKLEPGAREFASGVPLGSVGLFGVALLQLVRICVEMECSDRSKLIGLCVLWLDSWAGPPVLEILSF